MKLILASGSVALAACLFACNSTVVTTGQGGSTSATTGSKATTGSNATTGQTTGQTSTAQTGTGQTGTTTGQAGTTTGSQTGTTTVSSTGTGMVNPICTNTCNAGNQLSNQLNCTPDTGCTSTCEQLYTMYPQCTSQIDSFFNCLKQQISPQTCQCDPMNGNKMKCGNICMQQEGALSTCVSGG